jgi:hypothetical protein
MIILNEDAALLKKKKKAKLAHPTLTSDIKPAPQQHTSPAAPSKPVEIGA